MLGMTNAQTYWPEFCKAINRPELENDPKYATFDARQKNAAELVKMIEEIFLTKTYVEWMEHLGKYKLVWSPICTPLETTRDEQAIANEFFIDWDHPDYGPIKVLNNPIKLSKTLAGIQCRAPELGEHTDELMAKLGYDPEEVKRLKETGVIG